ncbi:MAG: acylphosphatase [Gemmatimonadota bacterium]
MSVDEVRRAVRLTGRVQGVGFRWWTRHTAEEIGVRGTVRNAVDGSVEVRFAGPADAVDRFMEALRAGPPYARVDRLEEMSPPDRDLPDTFEIVR